MELKDNIYKLRKDKRISQEELAEKVNVTRQTISNWELGSTSPNPKQLLLLSNVLNVSVDELMGNASLRNEENLGKISSMSKDFVLFILFLATSIIWIIASIVCLFDNNLTSSILDFSLGVTWSIISIIWYYKKIK